MRFKKFGDAHRAVVVTLNTKRQSLQATQNEVSGVRVDDTTKNIMKVSASRNWILLTNDDTGEHVIMTAHELGCAVNHQIRTEVERAGVARSRERAIDAHETASRLAQLDNALDIDTSEVRIRRRLRKVQRALVLL